MQCWMEPETLDYTYMLANRQAYGKSQWIFEEEDQMKGEEQVEQYEQKWIDYGDQEQQWTANDDQKEQQDWQ